MGAARHVVLATLILAVAPACQDGAILAKYGSAMPEFPDQCEGGRHPGVDFRAPTGSSVLASANGVVLSVRTTKSGGGVLLIWHEEFDRYTAYAHLDWPLTPPEIGEEVVRGQIIGRVGMFRNSGSSPHVHLELCMEPCVWGHPSCYLEGTENPLRNSDGCFDEEAVYSEHLLVLTYPVPC